MAAPTTAVAEHHTSLFEWNDPHAKRTFTRGVGIKSVIMQNAGLHLGGNNVFFVHFAVRGRKV